MKKYFRELLVTLKAIEKHLAKLAECVRAPKASHGERTALTIKDWND